MTTEVKVAVLETNYENIKKSLNDHLSRANITISLKRLQKETRTRWGLPHR